MHRIYSWFYKIRRFFRRFRKPLILGANGIVVRDEHVLLVRLTYLRGWSLPGGTVDRGESFAGAVVRELYEECGIDVQGVKLLGLYLNRRDDMINHVAVYSVTEFSGEPRRVDHTEISEVRFFHFSQLPDGLWPGHKRRIDEYLGLRTVETTW